MDATQELTNREILEVLLSTVCACGATKRPRMSHCRRCYYSLPPEIRQSLYKRFGNGYEEAYRNSLKYLRENQ